MGQIIDKKHFAGEEIIGKLREGEILLGQGLSAGGMLRKVEVSGGPASAGARNTVA